MTPARFREILRTLCWTVSNLAQVLAIRVEEVQRWHDALEPVPNNVAHWLQTLASVDGFQNFMAKPLRYEILLV